MTTLDSLPAGIAREFATLVDGVWDGRVDPPLLERCRRRVCQLVGVHESVGRHRSAPESGPMDGRAAACLAFVDTWVIDPHGVTDEMAAAVRRHLDDTEVAAFTIGLATMEAQARAARALAVLG